MTEYPPNPPVHEEIKPGKASKKTSAPQPEAAGGERVYASANRVSYRVRRPVRLLTTQAKDTLIGSNVTVTGSGTGGLSILPAHVSDAGYQKEHNRTSRNF